MKKLLFTLGFIAFVGLAASAQSTTIAAQGAQVVKQEIHISEAPQSVQIAFRDEQADYNLVSAIWEVAEGNQKFYTIAFDKEGKTWELKYAADGALLERNERKNK